MSSDVEWGWAGTADFSTGDSGTKVSSRYRASWRVTGLVPTAANTQPTPADGRPGIGTGTGRRKKTFSYTQIMFPE